MLSQLIYDFISCVQSTGELYAKRWLQRLRELCTHYTTHFICLFLCVSSLLRLMKQERLACSRNVKWMNLLRRLRCYEDYDIIVTTNYGVTTIYAWINLSEVFYNVFSTPICAHKIFFGCKLFFNFQLSTLTNWKWKNRSFHGISWFSTFLTQKHKIIMYW